MLFIWYRKINILLLHHNNKQIGIMKATVSFKIPEFHSFATKEVNFKQDIDCETTFRNIWKSLSKNLDKNWESIEFEFNNKVVLVCRHWLQETNFNFEQSHQIQ